MGFLYIAGRPLVEMGFGHVAHSTSAPAPPHVYSPLDLGSALALWLDGQDATTLLSGPGGSPVANSAAIGRWSDKSTNNRHADQATSGAQPTRSDSGLNTRRCVFYSFNNELVAPAPVAGLSACEVWVVCATEPGTEVVAEIYDASGGGFWSISRTGATYSFYASNGAGGLASDWSINVGGGDTPALVRGVFSFGASASTRGDIDGVGSGSASVDNNLTGATFGSSSLHLGRRYDGTYSAYGGHGEVVIANRLLTTGEANDLRTYLKGRWGTP